VGCARGTIVVDREHFRTLRLLCLTSRMSVLFAISIGSFFVFLWATIAIVRHIRRAKPAARAASLDETGKPPFNP
jgi:hypothetical protein